jgi:DNA (cytosine-5)-methyltransferase 1
MKSHFKKLRHLDLFSGIGGFSLGLEATGGFETVAFCDIEEYPRKVLKKHWPHVKQYTDIKELTYDKLKSDGLVSNTEKIDILTGGYPCQPFSVAGRKKGEKDPRHLWPEYFRLVRELRPDWIIGENVAGHIKLGLDTVLKNLESEGYSARTFSISASSVGANHQRERVWIVAHSERNGLLTSEERRSFEETISKQQERQNNAFNLERTSGLPFSSENVEDTRQHEGGIEPSGNKESIGRGSSEKTKWAANADQTSGSSEREETMANTNDGFSNQQNKEIQTRGNSINSSSSTMANTNSERGCSRETRWEDAENVGQSSRSEEASGWWDIEPNVGRVAHGIPKRVDRLKSLGNSLVPQIPYYIGLSILESYFLEDTDSGG